MITAARMAEVDRNAAAVGVPRAKLMESSGNAVARAVRERVDSGATVTMVCGRGNNGGDAFAAARFLSAYDVRVLLLGRPSAIRTEIARDNWDTLQETTVETTVVRDSRSLAVADGDPDLVVDAILGTGVSGAPREPAATAVRGINGVGAPVVSVDVPSGIDADTGRVTGDNSDDQAVDSELEPTADSESAVDSEPTADSEPTVDSELERAIDADPGRAVDADVVVTFHDTKPGLVALADAGAFELTVADIGIPAAAEQFVGPGDLQPLSRQRDSHKGDHGEVLVVGGGPYTGAPALAARAALRAGADLVRVAVPETVARELQGFDESLIVRELSGSRLAPEHTNRLHALAAAHDTVVLGPGIGDADETVAAVETFLADYDGTAVVDAEALSVVPGLDTATTLVCTPHRGEFAAMGGNPDGGWEERAEAVTTFAAETDASVTVLLKGPTDVISDGETTRVARTGNPAMTVGGTGDVLAGVTGALVAVVSPVRAAAVGAWANGRAGDAAYETNGNGLTATDLLAALPDALRDEGVDA